MKLLPFIFSTLVILSCEGEDSKDSDSNDKNGPGPTTGNLAIGSQVSEDLGQVNQNLKVVQTNLAPPAVGALALGSGENSGAQPNLLSLEDEADEIQERVKGTIEGSMRALDWIQGTINSLQPKIQGIEEMSGTIDLGFAKVFYEFETKDKYIIRDIGGEGGNYHVEVDGDHYLLYRTPNNPEPNRVGNNRVEVTYTDEDNWTLRDDNTWPDCDANRPEILTTYVEKKEGVWYGKMAYGNGSIHFNCPIEIAGQNYTYFQFVGDDEVTTAAGYSDVPSGFTDFTQIENYAMADETDQAVNPVCLEDESNSTPQSACVSGNADISTPNFGADDKWVSPDDIAKILVVFPEE